MVGENSIIPLSVGFALFFILFCDFTNLLYYSKAFYLLHINNDE